MMALLATEEEGEGESVPAVPGGEVVVGGELGVLVGPPAEDSGGEISERVVEDGLVERVVEERRCGEDVVEERRVDDNVLAGEVELESFNVSVTPSSHRHANRVAGCWPHEYPVQLPVVDLSL